MNQGLSSLRKSSLAMPMDIRGGVQISKKRRKKKSVVPRKSGLENDEGEIAVNASSDVNDATRVSSQRIDRTMPTIKAVLIPRQVSIPQTIRLASAFLFTSSLLESLRTSGIPYKEAVISTLQAHGRNLLLGHGGSIENEVIRVTPLDEYFAQKICKAENNMLPPKHFPSSLPLLGVAAASMMNVGLTTLFPKWFVEWDAWLNFQRIDIGNDQNQEELQMIESYLKKERNDCYEAEDVFYKSQLMNRSYARTQTKSNSQSVGISLLVKMSKQEREMSNDRNNAEDIQVLFRSESEDHPAPYFIEIGQRRIYVELKVEHGKICSACLDGGPSFHAQENIPQLIQRGSVGLSCLEDLEYAESVYGSYNDLSLPTPTVYDAFISRVSSPLTVLQLLGRLLSALEENFIPALMNILMTLGQHFLNAKKSIVSAKQLSNEIKGNVEDSRDQVFWTLRPKPVKSGKTKESKEWLLISAQSLLPGDVFFLPRNDFMMPVDALVLEGCCISQEAVITGESVPQAKSAIEPDGSSGDSHEVLSMELKHRNSVLFAGTTVMSSVGVRNDLVDKRLPQKLLSSSSSVKCLALKTGSYSSKGEIIRALSKSSGQAGGISSEQSDRDAIRLIGALSGCAVVACFSLFISNADHAIVKTSGFRRVIQCTRICVASIPSDLPLALNSVVHSCAATLRLEADVVCSDLGSLLTASQIEMVVFDKTGTLTSDTQAMTNITSLPGQKLHPMADAVLAGCHSLSSINSTSKTIGDPMDIAGLEYSHWAFNSTDKSAVSHRALHSQSGKKLWQIKSFPFDASRRRSSALVLVYHEDGSTKLWKVVKGSPEGMRSLLRCSEGSGKSEVEFLSCFEQTTEALGSKGMRSVAMGVQDISESTLVKVMFPQGLPKATESKKDFKSFWKAVSQARQIATSDLHINVFEQSKSLDFAGFACFDASIRPSTPRVIRHIRQSGTKVCMLTGDGFAAALAVAKKANFFDKSICKRIAVLDTNEFSHLQWKELKYKSSKLCRTREFSFDTTLDLVTKQKNGSYSLAVTGNAVEVLLERARSKPSAAYMLQNLQKVAVIARSSPQTKQQVLSILKSNCENKVMMCGDGVNDISAMKTADISAALLNGYGIERICSNDAVDTENERRKAKLKQRKIGRSNDAANFGIDGQSRIKMKLEESLKDSQDPQIGVNALVKLVKEEFKRAKELQKGGSKAAKILQREENLRKSITEKSLVSPCVVEEDVESIRPGEASLAASFTFLRPCIDGADSIVRNGIAAAAFALSSHR
jgi:magnesium-transporting ATPase (P-type)